MGRDYNWLQLAAGQRAGRGSGVAERDLGEGVTDFLTLMQQDNLKNQDGYIDGDIAEFCLGASLGLWKYDNEFQGFRDRKWIFCSANKTGDGLCMMLIEMVKAEILEGDIGAEGVRVRNYPWKEED